MTRPRRYRHDNRPTIVDLFAGAGGLSLGAARAGFNVVAAVDNDPHALETHTKNFPCSKHISRTIRTLDGDTLLELAGLPSGALDGLIGGPPCQGFSAIGYHNSTDARNHLFSHFFRLVAETKPNFFLVENVPGILSKQYSKLIERATSYIARNYNLLKPIRVTASDYGTPTKRTRIFFIGFKKNGIDDIAIEDFTPTRIDKVLVAEALRGLPVKIDPDWQSEDQGWRAVREVERSAFLRKVGGNVPDGVGDKQALERYFERNRVSGCLGTIHAREVIDRFRDLEPGMRDPISKAIRLKADGLCPTLRAGTGSERGSYQAVRPIHHREPRVITPREAARLQGFPDWFVFHATKWHSFRQIGNSVSPIVAKYLLRKIHRSLA